MLKVGTAINQHGFMFQRLESFLILCNLFVSALTKDLEYSEQNETIRTYNLLSYHCMDCINSDSDKKEQAKRAMSPRRINGIKYFVSFSYRSKKGNIIHVFERIK